MKLIELTRRLSEKVLWLNDEEAVTVISGGKLIDGTGRPPIENATVVVRGERIETVGRGAEIDPPTGPYVRHVDATGLTIMPGLIDLHVHLSESEMDPIKRNLPGNESYRTLLGAVCAAEILEAGFTTVRELGHGNSANKYALTRAVNEGLIYGPRIQNAGWAISQLSGHGDQRFIPQHWVAEARARSTFASGPEECRRIARLNFGEGADLLKFYASEGALSSASKRRGPVPNFTLAEMEAMVEEARRRSARVAAHANEPIGAKNAVLAGVTTIEHGGSMGDDPEILKIMARDGIFFTPTLTVYDIFARPSDTIKLHAAGMAAAKARMTEILTYLPEAKAMGIKIGVGTDTGLVGNGDNARELELLVELGGFTPMEALIAGTRTAAEAMGWDEDIGTLEPGKLADVLLVRGDPLADIRCLRDKSNIVKILKSCDSLT